MGNNRKKYTFSPLASSSRGALNFILYFSFKAHTFTLPIFLYQQQQQVD
jgi:hypothetical protein